MPGLAAGRGWCTPVRNGSEVGVATDPLFGDDPDSYRGEFLYAVEMARAQHDPATDWDGFTDTLWDYLLRVFGVDDPAAEPPEQAAHEEHADGDDRAVARRSPPSER